MSQVQLQQGLVVRPYRQTDGALHCHNSISSSTMRRWNTVHLQKHIMLLQLRQNEITLNMHCKVSYM